MKFVVKYESIYIVNCFSQLSGEKTNQYFLALPEGYFRLENQISYFSVQSDGKCSVVFLWSYITRLSSEMCVNNYES